MGRLDVLNCGAGHLSFRFDKGDDSEVVKARGIIQDMLKRGYTILVSLPNGDTKRVKRFDPKFDEYIVEEIVDGQKKTERMPIKKTKATGVGRTAGG